MKYTTEIIISKFKEIHGNNYSYEKFVYSGIEKKGIIICKIHGDFLQTPHSHLKGSECKKCSNENRKMTQTCFIKRSNKIFDYKYNYDKFCYFGSKIKGIVICPIHGEFEISPHHHLKGIGCRQCYKESLCLTKEDFIYNAKLVHGNRYDYSEFDYKNTMVKGEIICLIHGAFSQSPHDHCSGRAGCPKCSHSISKEEIKFVEYLKLHSKFNIVSQKDNQYAFVLEKFQKMINKKLKPDIFVLNNDLIYLIIEFDGDFWHGKDAKFKLHPIVNIPMNIFAEKTEKRKELIKSFGFDIINIRNSEWNLYIKSGIISDSINILFGKI